MGQIHRPSGHGTWEKDVVGGMGSAGSAKARVGSGLPAETSEEAAAGMRPEKEQWQSGGNMVIGDFAS